LSSQRSLTAATKVVPGLLGTDLQPPPIPSPRHV